jgi:predicted ATPase
MGDAVNLAARLQAAAAPMSVLTSEATQRIAAPFFEFADRGIVTLKNRAEPVHAYAVIEPLPDVAWTRSSGLTSAVVGREAELALLVEAADAARGGHGRVVAILGEAGIGKSRLLTEWRGRMTSEQAAMRWVEANCVAHGQSLAYHLLARLVRSLLRIEGRSSFAEGAREECTRLLGSGAAETFPFVGRLLGLDTETAKTRQLPPQALRAGYVQAARELVAAVSAEGPLALVLNDVHWADPSSMDVATELLTVVAERAVTFAFAMRPDPGSPGDRLLAAARTYHGADLIEIALGPLDESETLRLLANLLGTASVPEQVRELVERKSEGNPLFVEELVRALIDRSYLRRDDDSWTLTEPLDATTLPDNLQSLLTSRIDRLPEDARHALRVASVVGRSFSVAVLERVLARVSQ